jgi:hypothetical protein
MLKMKKGLTVLASATLMIGLAVVATPIYGDGDGPGCWGCGTRPLVDGYYCPNGCLEEHIGGFNMSGWYGWRASHTLAYCCSCSQIHSTCMWGALESAKKVQLALEAATGLKEIISENPEHVEFNVSQSTLVVRDCDGDVLATYSLTPAQISMVAI